MKSMVKTWLAFIFLASISSLSYAQRVDDFVLKDAVTGNDFELKSHDDARAVVLVFTSLNCPFSKLYEERIVNLAQQFSSQGFVFAMINPHINIEEDESASEIKKRARERKIDFPFLMDNDQKVTRQFGVTKLPEVVVITPSPTGFSIAYRGAIDNNPQVPANANIKYLENALTAISNRRNPSPASSRPVGCNVRFMSH
jgi:peroxiredoxin